MNENVVIYDAELFDAVKKVTETLAAQEPDLTVAQQEALEALIKLALLRASRGTFILEVPHKS